MNYKELARIIKANEHGYYGRLSYSVEEDNEREQDECIAECIWIELSKRMTDLEYKRGDSLMITEALSQPKMSLDPRDLKFGEARVFKLLETTKKATGWHPYLVPNLDEFGKERVCLFMRYMPYAQN